jgi:glutaminyl-tRNA synthetase
VAKADSTVDIALLEYFVREDLNKRTLRRMGVVEPLKVVIDNYPEDSSEELDAINNPEDQSQGKRKVPFSKVLYIEKQDFMEDPPKKFFRLAPGREVRLRYAYFIKCNEAVKDASGNIIELRCTYDPATKGGDAPDGRKVKATLHWVSAQYSISAEVRLYDRLFTCENPLKTEDGQEFTANLNPGSLKIARDCRLEPSLKVVSPGEIYQFERLGYFCVDPDSTENMPVFNRTVTLRDQWAKIKNADK